MTRKLVLVLSALGALWASGCGGMPDYEQPGIEVNGVVYYDGDHVGTFLQGDLLGFQARPDSPEKVTNYAWNVSSEIQARGDVGVGSGPDFHWTPTEPGTFSMQLTVSYGEGNFEYATVYFKVEPKPTPVVITPPVSEVIFVFDKITGDGCIKVGDGFECEVDKEFVILLWPGFGLPDGERGAHSCRIYGPDGELWGNQFNFRKKFSQVGTYFATCELWKGLVLRCRVVIPLVCKPKPSPPGPDPSHPLPTVDLDFHEGNNTLGWGSTHATSCVASGAWSGARDLNGSEVIAENGLYTLTCTGPGGTATDTVNVTKFDDVTGACTSPPAIVGFLLGLDEIRTDQALPVIWETSNTVSARITSSPVITGWNGAVSVDGDTTLSGAGLQPGTYTLTLTAEKPGCPSATMTKSFVVKGVTPPPPPVFSIELETPAQRQTFTQGSNVEHRVRISGGQAPYKVHWSTYTGDNFLDWTSGPTFSKTLSMPWTSNPAWNPPAGQSNGEAFDNNPDHWVHNVVWVTESGGQVRSIDLWFRVK